MTIAETDSGSKPQDLTIDDFVTGLIAGLAASDVQAVSIRGSEFYAAVEKLYDHLRMSAKDDALNLRFRIILDRIYGDSPIVRDAISGAVQRDLISLDNPEYLDMRLKVNVAEAQILLDTLPGHDGLFLELAKEFVNDYPWIVVRKDQIDY